MGWEGRSPCVFQDGIWTGPIACNSLAVRPCFDMLGRDFVFEPHLRDKVLEEFGDPRSRTKIDAMMGERP